MLLTDIATNARPALDGDREEFRRLFNAGIFGEARRLAERVLEEDGARVVWVQNLASVAAQQGNLREAYSLLLTHRHLLADCPDHYAVANFHLSLGIVGKKLGQLHGSDYYFNKSATSFAGASVHFELAGQQVCVGYSENGWANLLIAWGRPEESFEHIDKAELLFNDAGEFARAAQCEDTRALAYEALERFVDAFECASRAVVTLKRCGPCEAEALRQAEVSLERVYARMKGTEAT